MEWMGIHTTFGGMSRKTGVKSSVRSAPVGPSPSSSKYLNATCHHHKRGGGEQQKKIMYPVDHRVHESK